MAKVIVDYVPMVRANEDTEVMVGDINLSFRRSNEIFRLFSNGINNIEFGDGLSASNVSCNFIAVSFGQAGVELTASHKLNRVPVAIVGTRLDKPGAIYFSKNASGYSTSGSEIYLKSDTDSLSGTIIIT